MGFPKIGDFFWEVSMIRSIVSLSIAGSPYIGKLPYGVFTYTCLGKF